MSSNHHRAKVFYDAEHNFLIFTFSGNGFLYKQILNMVGTCSRLAIAHAGGAQRILNHLAGDGLTSIKRFVMKNKFLALSTNVIFRRRTAR